MKIQAYTTLSKQTSLQDNAIEKFRLALLDLRDFGRVETLPNATYEVMNAIPNTPRRMVTMLICHCYQKNGDILVYDNARFEQVCKPTRIINPFTNKVFKYNLNSIFTGLVRTSKTIFKKFI